jgi:hypothetical protein
MYVTDPAYVEKDGVFFSTNMGSMRISSYSFAWDTEPTTYWIYLNMLGKPPQILCFGTVFLNIFSRPPYFETLD